MTEASFFSMNIYKCTSENGNWDFWTQYQFPSWAWSRGKRRPGQEVWETFSPHCIAPFLSCTHSKQSLQYPPGNDCKKVQWAWGSPVEALFSSQSLVDISFHGRGGEVWGRVSGRKMNHHTRLFINLTHGLLAQIEAGDCGNSNHVTRTVYYHEITNLLRRQYNLHISSPISNCLTLIWCWKAAHSRRGSARGASQLKSFRSHNGHPPGLQDFTRKGFKGEKSLLSDGKRDFWNRKRCLTEIILKWGQFLLFLTYQAAVREFGDPRKVLCKPSVDKCAGGSHRPGTMSFIRLEGQQIFGCVE